MYDKLDVLYLRLQKIGIDIELHVNFPWVYLYSVNNNIVKELFAAEHGFTIGFYPVRKNQEFRFSDIKRIFETIRKYK